MKFLVACLMWSLQFVNGLGRSFMLVGMGSGVGERHYF